VTEGDAPRRKRRGRPPKPNKRVPLGLLVSPELRSRLIAMANQHGRSITQQTELVIERGLELQWVEVDDARFNDVVDRVVRKWIDKETFEQENFEALVRAQLSQLTAEFARLAQEVAELRRELRTERSLSNGSRDAPTGEQPVVRTDTGDDQQQSHHSDREAAMRVMYSIRGKPGTVATLLPADLDLKVGEDGNVVFVSRDGRLVMETPFDLDTMQQIAAEALGLEGSLEKKAKPKRKSRRRTENDQ
jgi:hypothetical protein